LKKIARKKEIFSSGGENLRPHANVAPTDQCPIRHLELF